MVLLKEPDERQLWRVIAALFAVALLLLVASLSMPWFTATFHSGNSETQGTYWFEEWRYALCSDGECGDLSPKLSYDQAPAWDNLMSVAKILVGIGVVAFVGFGILLGLYYHGYLEQTGWLKGAWVTGFVGVLFGVTYFALNAGNAGATQIQELVAQAGFQGFERPEPRFWGSQSYAGGELVSAPGVGWLLAILGLVSLVPPTILLYQFPEPEEEAESDYSLDEEEAPRERLHTVES